MLKQTVMLIVLFVLTLVAPGLVPIVKAQAPEAKLICPAELTWKNDSTIVYRMQDKVNEVDLYGGNNAYSMKAVSGPVIARDGKMAYIEQRTEQGLTVSEDHYNLVVLSADWQKSWETTVPGPATIYWANNSNYLIVRYSNDATAEKVWLRADLLWRDPILDVKMVGSPAWRATGFEDWVAFPAQDGDQTFVYVLANGRDIGYARYPSKSLITSVVWYGDSLIYSVQLPGQNSTKIVMVDRDDQEHMISEADTGTTLDIWGSKLVFTAGQKIYRDDVVQEKSLEVLARGNSPQYSISGRYIAFFGLRGEIRFMNADGTNNQVLVPCQKADTNQK